jgi:hypothetical protein
MSHVRICPAGIIHSKYLANLPQEIASDTTKRAVEEFGTFHDTRAEVWSQLYRYKFKIGIRILTVSIK